MSHPCPLGRVPVLRLWFALVIAMGSLAGVLAHPWLGGGTAGAANAPGAFPVQGRLTDPAGSPLNGVYTFTFRLYDTLDAPTPVCTDSRTVTVSQGLFNTHVDNCWSSFTGQRLWLGIEVGGDGEMTPRQVLLPAPGALSITPGQDIVSPDLSPILELRSGHASGRGLRAAATSPTGTNYGVVAYSESPDGYGGYFYNSAGGVALSAGGSGIIRSTAQSALWISGNGVRKYQESDSTVIDLDSIGGAFVKRGATAGNKNVMLPITIPGTLYGQNIRVVALEIHWVGQTDFDGIGAVLLRRQTGVCGTSDCYSALLHDTADRVCDYANNDTGCVTSFDLTTNNVLSADSGALYLTLELFFNDSSTYVELGAVRLLLEHD